jgi:hypothetical protein
VVSVKAASAASAPAFAGAATGESGWEVVGVCGWSMGEVGHGGGKWGFFGMRTGRREVGEGTQKNREGTGDMVLGTGIVRTATTRES